MKTAFKKLLPKKLFDYIRKVVRYQRLKKSFIYDLNHYFKYSMNVDENTEKKLISKIILDTHVIEKGLTMPESKIGFGQIRLSELMKNTSRYIQTYNIENPQILHGLSVTEEYFTFHFPHKNSLDDKLFKQYSNLIELQKLKKISIQKRYQITTTKDEYFQHHKSGFYPFSSSRSSIRNFSDTHVSDELIYSAIDLARNTPSACNRQSVRIHLYKEKQQIADILKVQGGNRGFGHLAKFLIVITYEPSVYFEQNERNSGLVDGGLFAMNLLYSLHANKIAACILNAAHDKQKDLQMRNVTKIPASESFVVSIAGGIPPTEFKIAQSHRYSLSFFLTKH